MLVANFTVIRVHLVTVATAVMSELMFSFPVFTARAGGFEVHGLVVRFVLIWRMIFTCFTAGGDHVVIITPPNPIPGEGPVFASEAGDMGFVHGLVSGSMYSGVSIQKAGVP